MRSALAALAISAALTTGAAASFDRHAIAGSQYSQSSTSQYRQVRHAQRKYKQVRHAKKLKRSKVAARSNARRSASLGEVQILPHPVGCPARLFCGCGVSIEVFGRSIRGLWLSTNWFKFPRAEPAPGMVAVRRGHVFSIREVRGPGLVLAYDPNSGGRKTRLHLRRLAGYVIVNPHGRKAS